MLVFKAQQRNTYKKLNIIDLKSMSNNNENSLKTCQYLIVAYSGLISAGINRKTVLYSLKGCLYAN